jgi:hypothetical protein
MVKEIIGRLNCGSDGQDWVRGFGVRIAEFFLRHASLVTPLNDVGKLKLASDMTQLELGLVQLFSGAGMEFDSDVGLVGAYKSLRAFK